MIWIPVFRNPPQAENSIKEVSKMRKLGLLILVGLFLMGCGTAAKESQFWEHSTMYKNWDHLKYSWYGYEKPTAKAGKESVEQSWWGIPKEVKEADLQPK
jgi:hypothetical protein